MGNRTFNTGSLSSVITVDPITLNVGIGGAPTAYKANVTGAVAATNFVLSGATGNTGIYYGHTDRVVLANYTAGGIDFEVNGGATNMTLFPSGNLGVGAGLTDAGYRLDVAGTGRVTGNLSVGAATAATNVFLNLNGVSGKAQRIQFQNSGADQWLLGAGAASETSAFELYNASGTIVMSVDKASSSTTFNAGGTNVAFIVKSSNAGGTILGLTNTNGGPYNWGLNAYSNGSLFFQYGTLGAGSNPFYITSAGAGTFASSVSASSLSIGSTANSTNPVSGSIVSAGGLGLGGDIYMHPFNANQSNYGYIKTTATTVNTLSLTIGTTYGFGTGADAVTFYNGQTTFGDTSGYTLAQKGQFYSKGGGSMFTANLLSGGWGRHFTMQRNDSTKWHIGVDGSDNFGILNPSDSFIMTLDLGGVMTTNTFKSNITPGGYTLDSAGSFTALVNGAYVDFPSFSGMIIVTNTGTGAVQVFICGGGNTASLGYVVNVTGTMTHSSGVGGYRFTNNTGSTWTYSFQSFRTRTTA